MKILIAALFFAITLTTFLPTSANQSVEEDRSAGTVEQLEATDTGLVMMTSNSSSESYFRFGMIPPIVFVFVSLLLLVPHKPIYDAVLLFIMIVSLVGVVMNMAFGSWPWVRLFLADLIVVIISAVKIGDGASYLWRMPVILIALVALYLSA